MFALAVIISHGTRQTTLVRHTLEVQNHLTELGKAVLSEESNQRGFLLTGDSVYLEKPNNTFPKKDEIAQTLRVLLAEDTAQLARLQRVEAFMAAKVIELEQTKKLAAEGNLATALLIVNSDAGKRYMDSVDGELAKMRWVEEQSLWQHRAERDAAVRWVYVVLGGVILLLGYSLFTLYGQIRALVNNLAFERERYREADASKQIEINRRARLEAYNELLISNLEARNLALDRFAYITSHDLQQPLRTIKGVIEALREDFPELTANEPGEYFEMVSSSALRMDDMVSKLLRQSREGSSEDFMPLDLERVVLEVRSDLSQLIAEQNASLQAEALPFVLGPPTGLRVMFQNLITNAIKYSVPGRPPQITISGQELADENGTAKGSPSGEAEFDSRWRITVSDNGRGIDPARIQDVLQFGRRGDDHDDIDGHGFGLTACVEVARALGGELELESEVGVGSKFSFTAPTSSWKHAGKH